MLIIISGQHATSKSRLARIILSICKVAHIPVDIYTTNGHVSIPPGSNKEEE